AVVTFSAVSVAIWVVARPTRGPAPAQVRFELTPSPAGALWTGDAQSPDIAISPDGLHVAYAGSASATSETLLMVRRLDDLDAMPLPGTMGAHAPFFSPDGQW